MSFHTLLAFSVVLRNLFLFDKGGIWSSFKLTDVGKVGGEKSSIVEKRLLLYT